MSRKKTITEFMSEAKDIHGEKYVYSSVAYLGNKIPVTIICPAHGDFQQSPIMHLKGQGCPDCGIIKAHDKTRKSVDIFISESNKKHNYFYNYSLVKYLNAESPVIIICPIHGQFQQRPHEHSREGQGCPKCGAVRRGCKRRKPLDIFIEEANKKHNGFYDYSSVEYLTTISLVTIICPAHGPFPQIPISHLRGQGCPKCGGIKTRDSKIKSLDTFINCGRKTPPVRRLPVLRRSGLPCGI